MIARSATFALALTVAAPAFAQDATSPPEPAVDMNADSLTIGGGGAYMPDYEGSDDYRFQAVPGAIGSYKGFSFQLAGNRLSADIIPNRSGQAIDIQAGPLAVANFNRTSIKSIDDPRVKALGELDTAIELGGYVGIGKTGVITSPYDKLSLSVSYRYDVNGVHSSGILQPSVNYLTPLSHKSAIALFASAERAERGYAVTYYSISPAESVASGLPVYNARAGWKNWTVGAIGTVSVTGDLLHGLKLVGGVTYRHMLGDFADSPVVSIAGDKSQWLGAVGLAYTF